MIAHPQQSTQQFKKDRPRIYVACLAAYNNGHLHGRWIDALQDADDIQSEILEMLRESPTSHSEEWAIHDYEGFEGAELADYSSIETAVKLAGFVSEHGKFGGKLLAQFCCNLEDAEADFEKLRRPTQEPC